MKSVAIAEIEPPGLSDNSVSAIGMSLTALSIGFAMDIQLGEYSPTALICLTIALAFCIASVFFGKSKSPAYPSKKPFAYLPIALAAGIIAEAAVMLSQMRVPMHPAPAMQTAVKEMEMGLTFITLLAILQLFKLRGLRWPILILMLLTFFVLGTLAFRVLGNDPHIDVYLFQQNGVEALLHGHNPYAIRIPNIYGPDTPNYGPDILDRTTNRLTVGYCYFPLSLLMAIPGYLIGGDVRYSLVAAAALSAGLIATARPGKISALSAGLFILTPCIFFLLDMSWTDTFMVFSFSILMSCACRWRKMLPYALGLFLATKQYSLLCLPAVWLLTDGPNPRRQIIVMLSKAVAVAALLTIPFFLWGPWDFWHSVVLMQIRQPFRADALSYLVWLTGMAGHAPADWIMWLAPLLALTAAAVFAMAYSPRTPAGFAAAVALINLAFFAFSKQAFCNYYFFVFAAACWSVAARRISSTDCGEVQFDNYE